MQATTLAKGYWPRAVCATFCLSLRGKGLPAAKRPLPALRMAMALPGVMPAWTASVMTMPGASGVAVTGPPWSSLARANLE